jgi:hypothetical protein
LRNFVRTRIENVPLAKKAKREDSLEEAHARHEHQEEQKNSVLYQIGKWGAVGVIIAYLLTEHLQHVIQYLPFLILLSCPLMHFFMHGKHGHSQHRQDEKDGPQ